MPKPDHPWYKTRGYIHFDLPISIKQAESIATSPDRVKKHSFYPFISYEIKSKKISRNKENNRLEVKPKSRSVCYASHVDSHIYTYYTYRLNEAYENLIEAVGIQNSVIGFRKLGKSNIDFANAAFDEIIERNYCTAIALDIEGFFDNLDHDILKNAWCRVLGTDSLSDDHYNIFKSLTKFSKVDKKALYERFNISKRNPKSKNKRICEPKQFRDVVRNNSMIKVNHNKKGIPQGSPISVLLSNIYMFWFDEEISKLVNEFNGCYFRYCDDILCIVPHGRKEETKSKIFDKIKYLKLTINNDKTKTSDFRLSLGQLMCDKPLQYLGFTFDGRHKLIRSAALARFSERMKAGVRLAKLTKIKYNTIRIMKGLPIIDLYKRKIYERYSHLGERNFIRYGFRSAETMNSNALRKQLKPLWNRLQAEILK
jgi:RNA-directed DNA polymerase